MKKAEDVLIFLVDDDALYLKSLEIDFAQNTKYIVKTFLSGELCLENLSQNPNVIILDYHLDSIDHKAINGLEVLDGIKKINPNISVIILSSQDKIEVAVNCMKHRAFDYIVKSETAFFRLKKAIVSLLQFQRIEKTLKWYMDKM